MPMAYPGHAKADKVVVGIGHEQLREGSGDDPDEEQGGQGEI